MSGVMKMVIILIAVLVVCAAGYGIGNAVGLFGGDSKKTEEERKEKVPNLSNLGLTEEQASKRSC